MDKKPLISILICMGLIISTLILLIPTTSSEKIFQSLKIGDILFVGGSGPNNYSKIQEAIDDSKFGDTVYVFDDSSPYREFLIIDKSVNLIGEDQNTTILEGYDDTRQPLLQLNANGIHLHGFTIQNSTYISPWPPESYWAIEIASNTNDISGNILTNNAGGIYVNHSSRNSIYDNSFTNGKRNSVAIGLMYGKNNKIFHNSIVGIRAGILMENVMFNEIYDNSFSQMGSSCIVIGNSPVSEYSDPWYLPGCNRIHNNFISDAERGISLAGVGLPWCYFNFVYQNEITRCQYGINRLDTRFIFIKENNFINNSCNAFFHGGGIGNQWSRNYWDDWNGSGYYTIHGEIDGIIDPEADPVPAVQHDRHPAQKPYDLFEMKL